MCHWSLAAISRYGSTILRLKSAAEKVTLDLLVPIGVRR
jgi:hypothetical protein